MLSEIIVSGGTEVRLEDCSKVGTRNQKASSYQSWGLRSWQEGW